ncbi:response regulator [Novosphingobium sp. NBM11]|uniref:response regulator n=1 Tax=Novosphingobium sp. NBM11 TaxID=2596914 RepID=UPI0018927C15|nr:response regulator [Novosphingobium sp. NBM11]MBF5090108.1 response regulator [Novosphingobium sp. NBM11]
MNILCLEDDALVGGVLCDLMRDLGHDVVYCTTGHEALHQLSESRGFDVLVTDIHLRGGVDSRSVVQLARESGARLPVIYITGDMSVQDIAPGDQILRKPCTLGKLDAALSSVRAR